MYAATLKLLEPLSGKEAKTYEPVIAAIAGEVLEALNIILQTKDFQRY